MYILNTFVNLFFYQKFTWGTPQGSVKNKTYNLFLVLTYVIFSELLSILHAPKLITAVQVTFWLVSFFWLNPVGYPRWIFGEKKRLTKVFKIYIIRLSFLRWFQIYYSFPVEL